MNSAEGMDAYIEDASDDPLVTGEPCQYTYFAEADEFKATLAAGLALEASLLAEPPTTDPAVANAGESALYLAFLPLHRTLAKYHAQPQLMDAHLAAIIAPVMDLIRTHYLAPTRATVFAHGAFNLLIGLANARGPKYIVKFFSHEVADLEGLLRLVVAVHSSAFHLWPVRYMLLLWMSFVTLLPFEITRLGTKGHERGIVARVLETAKGFLAYTGKERDGAAMLIGRLVSRVDVAPTELPAFVAWAEAELDAKPNVFKATGILQTLCCILKFAERGLLLPHLDQLAALLRFADAAMVRTNSLLRKLVAKLATRVGLVMLRNKLPKWRYDRGSRSLEANIRRAGAGAAGGLVTSGPANPAPSREEEDEDEEIPEQIEEVLHVVLAGLRDRDTIVRWSAAKGVGRITYRLPEELAADVVQSVIDLFNENVHASTATGNLDISGVSEHTWHGACLSIAELARRGLLLPAVLDTAMTWIQLALTFDIRRGNYSIGSPVRDAACYVCWSFARAYAPDIMRPHVHRLAPSLVCVSMYDREVHVRRAASAAFQENVGRQGIFPHGIDIVTAADFFTVGNRASAFLVAGRAIAAFDEYHPYCVRYLLENSVFHWDPAVRVLAAEALGVLVDLKPDIFQHLFDTLLPTITSTELGTRHGSAVALAEVILAAGSGVVTLAHADAAVAQLRAIAPAFLQTFGSELTRQGALKLVAALATVCAVPEATIDLLIPLIESSVERKEVPLQEAAAATAAAALRRVSPARLAAVVGWWVHAARPSGDQVARRGYALALGEVAMPLDLSVQTVEALIASTENLAKPQIDAEAKKNALQAVGKHVVQHGAALPPATVARIVAAFLGALDDYTTTSHGDVGSWVRMEAMAGLALVVEHAVLADPAAVVPAIARGVVHQTLSKIDRVREVAGPVLARLLAAQQAAGHIPAVDVLQRVVAPAAGDPSLDWSNSASVLAAVAPVLAEPFYRETAVLGYLLCMGGMTESLVKAAGQVLMDHLEGLADDDAALAAATDAILATLTSNYRVDRVVLPVLTALDILYANQSVLYAPDAFHAGVYAAVRREIAKVKDVNKILAAFKVLGGLAGVPHRETRTCAARYLAQQTCHVYPRVRKGAAETLLACAPIYAQACEDDGGDAGVRDVDRVTTLLTEVDWTLPIADVKAHRDELYAMLGVDGVVLPPVPDA
ncbi:hypothetical protein H9P43_007106 [Blastocladiella emersonii ATCC 22665]|nr:hypothetical protein H9P43_007106 [Blastocladiella emersonii ATCC 22665]